MSNWTRKPQEVEGDYFFSGKSVMTIGVSSELDMLADIIPISMDLRDAVNENNGLDYLQVYECDDGRVVWIIDALSKSMKEGSGYTPEQVSYAQMLCMEGLGSDPVWCDSIGECDSFFYKLQQVRRI